VTGPVYFDDLHVGQRFTSGSHPIDEAEIIRFAREFDPQLFHLDAEAARHSVFGGLVASGWHTAAITMRLLVEGELQLAGGMIGLGGDAQWPNPTRPGDILQVHSEVTEMRPTRSRPDRGIVTLRSETRNQRADILQILTAKLLVPRQVRT
jgi:acyl dehydratase